MGRPKKNPETVISNQPSPSPETTETAVAPTQPSIDDAGWTEYVISLLDPKTELTDGKPKAAGLRRIFSQVTDWIVVESYPQVIQTPMPENEQRATVIFTLVVRNKNDGNNQDNNCRFSDASDCYWGNTAKPFCRHPVATAATMAEGRVLRKILKLNVVTLEETLQPTVEEEQINDIMTDSSIFADKAQKNAITLVARKNGIDLRKAMVHHKMPVPDDEAADVLSLLSRVDAANFFQIMNNYNRGTANGGLDIPAEIKRGNQ